MQPIPLGQWTKAQALIGVLTYMSIAMEPWADMHVKCCES